MLQPERRRAMTGIPVVLDVDTGLDDSLALLLAARSPVLDLLGMTGVTGNVTDLALEDALAYANAAGALSVTSLGLRACYRTTRRSKHASASEGHEPRIEPQKPLNSCSGERTKAH